jgi:D-arabinose 1-dehydrogenase-like Zn-dependent alcohol dehydrogenase
MFSTRYPRILILLLAEFADLMCIPSRVVGESPICPLSLGTSSIRSHRVAILIPFTNRHEIVGIVKRVGSKVTDVKPGDRAGVGAQCLSCLKPSCRACSSDNENYCPGMIDTYGAKFPDGVATQGGYSTAIIANNQFVFPIPDSISSSDACSMFCAGLTVYSPLVRNGITKEEGKGKKVAVVGLGGLGHYAVLFAKALGAEVWVFSHSDKKEEDAKKMGADHYVNTSKVCHFFLVLSFRLNLTAHSRISTSLTLSHSISSSPLETQAITSRSPNTSRCSGYTDHLSPLGFPKILCQA